MDYKSYYDKEYFTTGTKSNYTHYDDAPEHLGRARDLRNKFPDAKTILDVGCATGTVVKHLRELGFDAYGCDVSEWAIENRVDEHCVVGSVLSIPFTKKFDVVTSCDMLEHIAPEDVEQALSELLRVGDAHDHAISTWSGKTAHEHLSIHEIGWWQERIPGAHIPEYQNYIQLGTES